MFADMWGVREDRNAVGKKCVSRLCAKASCFVDFHLIKPRFWLVSHDRITLTFFS